MMRTAAIAIGLIFASCNAAPEFRNVTPLQADSLIRADSAKKTFHLIDIRTPEEFATGRIRGARIMDFYAPDFQTRLSKLPRDAKILLYCRSGNRSGQALSTMRTMGFTDAGHVAGGINAWRSQGLPVEP